MGPGVPSLHFTLTINSCLRLSLHIMMSINGVIIVDNCL